MPGPAMGPRILPNAYEPWCFFDISFLGAQQDTRIRENAYKPRCFLDILGPVKVKSGDED